MSNNRENYMRWTTFLAATMLVVYGGWAEAEDTTFSRTGDGLDLVHDGQPTSVIVVPSKALPVVRFAAEELQHHVKASAGATLPIREEGDATDNSQGVVFLGECRAADGVAPRKALSPNGYHIQLHQGNLYLSGDDSDGPVLDSRGIKGSLHDNKTRVGTLFAVYEFLDKQLGVRWLWPGRLGEVIPKQKSLRVTGWNQTYAPKLLHSRLRDYYTQRGPGWSSPAAADRYFYEQAIWLRRQRFAQGQDLDYGHAFHEYWKRFGKTHPEFFALRPNGKREPGRSPHLVQMCVSQRALWKRIVDDWKANANNTDISPRDWINGAENDSAGDPACTCKSCRAWDVSGTDSLSDRYARFWLELQRMGSNVSPNATVIGYAYGTYSDPPRAVRLNKRIVVAIVPDFYFPWTDEARERFRAQWKGWTGTAGARAYLRPNYFHFGHNMPIFIARKFGEDFGFAWKRGMLATDFDMVPGQWSTQGPALYVLGRIHHKGDWSVDKILDEYYGGFGAAESAVRAYFAYWERITNAVTPEHYEAGWKSKGITDNPEHRFYRWAAHIFTAEVMAEGRRLLEVARRSAADDPTIRDRVAFLENGLRHAELTLAVQSAWDHWKAGGDSAAYAAALQRLDRFRGEIDREFSANMAYLRSRERLWNRDDAKQLLPGSNR